MTCCTRLAPCESCCNRGRAQLAAKLAHFATRGMVETHGKARAPTPWSDYVDAGSMVGDVSTKAQRI